MLTELVVVSSLNHADSPRGSLLVFYWVWFLHSDGSVTETILLAPFHTCLSALLHITGPVWLLSPVISSLIFSGRPSHVQTHFPSQQRPIPTAEAGGGPLLRLVGSLRSPEGKGIGPEACVSRGCHVIFRTGVLEACAVAGEERGDTVLPACRGFDRQVWRELCVGLVAGLAILELNHGFNFILYQLKKHNVLENPVFTNGRLSRMPNKWTLTCI